MVYHKYVLHPPPTLRGLNDQQRKFAPRLWDLVAVQQALLNGQLGLTFSTVASDQLTFDLGWNSHHAKGFFCELKAHHYLCSEWIHIGSEPKVNNQPVIYAADVYSMGYNKGLGHENDRARPYTYIKFTVKGNNLLVANCHPEKDPADRGR